MKLRILYKVVRPLDGPAMPPRYGSAIVTPDFLGAWGHYDKRWRLPDWNPDYRLDFLLDYSDGYIAPLTYIPGVATEVQPPSREILAFESISQADRFIDWNRDVENLQVWEAEAEDPNPPSFFRLGGGDWPIGTLATRKLTLTRRCD